VAFAVGIVSAAHRADRRAAIRETWASMRARTAATRPGEAARAEVARVAAATEIRFFLGTASDGSVPAAVRTEARIHGDIEVLAARDTYDDIVFKAVGIFLWGARRCGAAFSLRVNDDVYLRLPALLAQLRQLPPVRILAGHIVPRGAAIVVRPHDVAPAGVTGPLPAAGEVCAPGSACEVTARKAVSQHVVGIGQYPSTEYPAFAQGNCVILSRDLAEAVAHIADMERKAQPLFADDLLVGLTVATFRPELIHFQADLSFHSGETRCSEGAISHYDIGPRSMRMLYANDLAGRRHCAELGGEGSVFPDR
jgi:hypothetical protein